MSGVAAPPRSVEHRMVALEKANRIRVDRAKLKRCLADGSMSAVDVLEDPPDYAWTMKVRVLLIALPKYGPVKADRLLFHCRISPAKTVGGLSDRQRDELIGALS